MKRTDRIRLMVICALVCASAAAFWSRPKLIHAQQNTGETYTGLFYISAYIDVDSGYNVYGTSVVQSDDYAEVEYIGGEGYISQDASYIAYDSDSGYDRIEFNLSSDGPVTPGHNYGVQTDGYECSDYGEYDAEEECDDVEYAGSAFASVYVSPQPPQIASLSTYTVNQGDTGLLTITGTNLAQSSGDQLNVQLSGSNGPFALNGTPSSGSAQFIYNFAAYPPDTYTLTLTNNEGTSNGVSFTVASQWPANPCDVEASPKTQYSSFISTSTPGGSGTMTVSFSGSAYSSVSQSVLYGPNSTPSSIAANIAALITANYTKIGLTARAFGSNIIYSGNQTLGTVTHAITGSSIATTTSFTAAAAAETACEEAPPTPVPVCGVFVSHKYVLAVTHDSVSWEDSGMNYGRNVTYSLELWPTTIGGLGEAPPPFQSTVTEHLTARMSFGYSSSGTVSGEFHDVLGNIGANQSGTYVTDRCFTVTSPTMGNLGQVVSYDAAGTNLHAADHIEITQSTLTSILNKWKNPDDSPKSVELH